MKKVLSILIAVILAVSSVPVFSLAGNSVVADGIIEISKYGNVKINLSHEVVSANFELGDVVTVSFGDVSIDVPLCITYANVDSGCAGLFCQISSAGVEETELAINMGSFAETYGIAQKTVYPDKTYKWEYLNGFSDAAQFVITLKEKAGYLEEFAVRNLIYTNKREDYPELTDAQYANFRMVTAGNIAAGVLYRSSSPVDPSINRNSYADNACRKNGITHFINLSDSEEKLADFEGYGDSYYRTAKHIAVAASMNPAADENKAKFAECYRYIVENPTGRFNVHCLEGKDRTGVFVAVLECLMGASYDEVIADYMLSFENYYGISENDAAYGAILNGNIRKTLTEVFGVDPEGADLVKEAEEYLKDIGLSSGEITSLKSILSGNGELRSTLNSVAEFVTGILPVIIGLLVSLLAGLI